MGGQNSKFFKKEMVKKAVIFLLLGIGQGFNAKAQNTLEQWDAYLKSVKLESCIWYYEVKAHTTLYSILYFEYNGDPYLIETRNGKVTRVKNDVDFDLFDFVISKKPALKKLNNKTTVYRYSKNLPLENISIDTSLVKSNILIKHGKLNLKAINMYGNNYFRAKYKAEFAVLDEIAIIMHGAFKKEEKAEATIKQD